jgi:hypothetical protein
VQHALAQIDAFSGTFSMRIFASDWRGSRPFFRSAFFSIIKLVAFTRMLIVVERTGAVRSARSEIATPGWPARLR